MQKVQTIHFEKLDSTINWVKAHLDELNPNEITCITASHQTAGKGRLSRKWISERGNLLMTLFYTLKQEDPRILNLAQLMSLAVCSLFPAKIKWPNDLFVDGKKLGGILVELLDLEGKIGVIHSLGLNVNTPIKTDQPTISVYEWLGEKYDLHTLATSITRAYFEELANGFCLVTYNDKLMFKGKHIACQTGSKKVKGTLLGVDSLGMMRLQQEDGVILTISSGDLSVSL